MPWWLLVIVAVLGGTVLLLIFVAILVPRLRARQNSAAMRPRTAQAAVAGPLL
jgi:RsiW-degrading membrane proteinase PrsW (M82 family)